jgi:hypothetical protein
MKDATVSSVQACPCFTGRAFHRVPRSPARIISLATPPVRLITMDAFTINLGGL